jgi:hypothetical protein
LRWSYARLKKPGERREKGGPSVLAVSSALLSVKQRSLCDIIGGDLLVRLAFPVFFSLRILMWKLRILCRNSVGEIR